MTAKEYSVFPLHTVLFPGSKIALRIFEQRYLRMVSESMKDGEPFVISLIRDSSSEVGEASECFSVATLAKIIDFNQGSGGVLDIVAEGIERVALENFRHEPDNLLKAVGNNYAEFPIDEFPEHYLFFKNILASVKKNNPELMLANAESLSATELSFLLSYVAPASMRRKQKLLELKNTEERFSHLQVIYAETQTSFIA